MIITLRLKYIVLFVLVLGVLLTTIAFVFAKDNEVVVPIIMYHSILKDASSSGKFVITPTELEQDLIYLKEQGYTAIFMEELINFVKKGERLPEKPVILTFDDGCYNNYVYGYPLVKKYNMKMVMSVVGSYAERYSETQEENANYSYLTWERIKELKDSGYAEIQNHSFDMHTITAKRNGSKKNRGESKEHYKKVFMEDTLKNQILLKEKAGVTATTYTYPFGGISDDSEELLEIMGFSASLSCGEGMNYIKEGDSLYQLKRYNRKHGQGVSKILNRQ
ncbi:MAG: polysaccharide deacetylase family protein [Clostridia bacterium]|nr:polysaccharide deacetylase family protein [Clostridia bacterium]MBQ4543720.1 polysaccharide deacetylase family protein [Clostridia bacterium]